VKPIRLRPDESGPELKPLEGDADAGKYQLQGEIARGGVGTVLKGFDAKLGRDVAIKLLREDYLGNPDLLQRFVEEAQIGGQLQHPGIVPVYDVGLQGDRPYFSMKLVKGRTLAAMLEERADPDHEPRKYLAIFEQVCHTMAYAHARAVIHRDLKPSNVMVGAFGEVQVVDWGMGKVLGRGGIAHETRAQMSVIATVRSEKPGSQSVVGSVMGTPAYMPPEQARGEVERMDERSDVFALGAVLCEILTGAPPYVGPELIEQAAQADLAACHERLDACSADEELKQLVRSCLAPARMARPKDARALAERIGGYLTSVDERAEQARIDAAEHAVRTREAKRSQRLTFAIAASVLLTLALGGGSWWWWQDEQAQRRATAGNAVRTALREARVALRRSKWDEALAVAQRAGALAQSDDVAPELREAADDLVREAERRKQHAAAEAERLRRERAVLARLEAVPIPDDHEGGQGSRRRGAEDSRRRDFAYRDEFRDFGLPIDELAVEEAAARIRKLERPQAWAAVLDDWALAIETLGADSSHVLRIAKAADPNPHRDSLRDMRIHGAVSLAELVKLADEADDFEPMTTILLAEMLTLRGERGRGVALLKAAYRRSPGDYLLAHRLANLLGSGARSDASLQEEALRFAATVVALRPQSATGRFMYAVALRHMKRLPEAEVAFRKVIAINEAYAQAHHNLAHVLQDQGKHEESLVHFREAIKDPRAKARNCYAWALQRLGRNEEAERLREEARNQRVREAYEAVVRNPRDAMTVNNYGAALGSAGRITEALEQYDKATLLDRNLALAHANRGSALFQLRRIDDAIAALSKAVQLDPKDAWTARELGTILLQHGKVEEGIRVFREAVARSAEPRALLHFNLGVWFHGQKQLEKAAAEYRKAVAADEKHHRAWTNLGDIHQRKGELDEAVAAARRAIEAHPDDWHARMNIAKYLLRQGKTESALEELRRLDRSALPTDANVHHDVGVLLAQAGAREEGIARLRRAVRIDAKSAMVRYTLGSLLQDAGELEQAISCYREAVRLKPRMVSAQHNLGLALRRMGRYRESLAALEKRHALEAAPRLLAEARRLAALEPRLDSILDGQLEPRDVAEAGEAVLLAARRQRYERAVALAQAAGVSNAGRQERYRIRYNGACAAARLGRTDQALEWLRAALAQKPPRARLRHWLEDPDLASLRDDPACAGFWDEVRSAIGGK
jgi:serine/threonine-protein kinase